MSQERICSTLSECSGFGTDICEIQFNLGMREGPREEVVFELDLTYGKICRDGSWGARRGHSDSGNNGYLGPSPKYSKWTG